MFGVLTRCVKYEAQNDLHLYCELGAYHLK